MMRRLGHPLTARRFLATLPVLVTIFAVSSRPVPLSRASAASAPPRSPLDQPVSQGATRPSPEADALVVVTPEGRRVLPVVRVDGHPMVALDDLAALFRLAVREEPLAAGLSITYQGRSILLGTSDGLASAEGRLIQLSVPPTRQARRWLVPVEFIGRVLPLVYDQPIAHRRAAGLVVVGNVNVPRVTARAETQTRLVLEIAPPTPHTIVQEPGRLVLRFDAPAVELVPGPLSGDLVSGLKLGDAPGTVIIELGPRAAPVQTTAETAEQRTRLTVALSAATPPAEPERLGPRLPPEPLSGVHVDTVVLDPGHGGEDVGARGVGGALEKDVTLGVARRIKALIEQRLGWRVILTRTADQTVDLDARAALANNNKADAFVSLHANASVRPAVMGAEVFYLSVDEYGDEAGRASAASVEEVPTAGGGSRRLDIVRWEMAQVRHLQQSTLLAETIQEELRKRVPMNPRGLQPAPFRVLAGANMPAVLVELGFLTNPDDERRLTSEEFQNQAAQALVEGLARFRELVRTGRGPAARTSSGGLR